MASFSIDGAGIKRAVLAGCVIAALTTGGLAAAHGQRHVAAAALNSKRFSDEAVTRWLDTPRWMQTPLMASVQGDVDGKGPGISGLVPVLNCEDDLSPGSLRKVLESAQNRDIVDLTHLTCSTITLQHGELHLSADLVKVFGPTTHALTIDAHSASRNLYATPANESDFYDLSFANGLVSAEPYVGGCLYSSAVVVLTRATLSGCAVDSAHTTQSMAGGAIYAGGVLGIQLTVHDSVVTSAVNGAYGGGIDAGFAYLFSSDVSGNRIESNAVVTGGAIVASHVMLADVRIDGNTAHSFGDGASGGAIVGGNIRILAESAITHNSAHSDSTSAKGGGVIGSDITIDHATLSGNVATSDGTNGSASVIGGAIVGIVALNAAYSTIDDNKAECTVVSATSQCKAYAGGVAGGSNVTLSDVTISGNSAEAGDNAFGGGIFVGGDKVLTSGNSTIAFNHSSGTGGGVVGSSPAGTPSLLNNTIVTNNDTAVGGNDFAVAPGAADFNIAGSHTVTMFIGPNVHPLTIFGIGDPALKPLADNGGGTKTHAIDDQSPAFDAGVDTGMTMPRCDQRGAGFKRTAGAAPDIGAFEVQDNDEIFVHAFEIKGTDNCNF